MNTGPIILRNIFFGLLKVLILMVCPPACGESFVLSALGKTKSSVEKASEVITSVF
jgi:hypothetical protein